MIHVPVHELIGTKKFLRQFKSCNQWKSSLAVAYPHSDRTGGVRVGLPGTECLVH